MRYPIFSAVFGAMMAAGFFLPWIEIPTFGDAITLAPSKLLSDDRLKQNVGDDWRIYVLPASCLFGAIIAAMGFLLRRTPRILVIFTGAFPIGMLIWALVSLRGELPEDLPLPSGGNPSELLQYMGYGLFLYVGGTVLVLLNGLFGR
jgi:hypothetical protein